MSSQRRTSSTDVIGTAEHDLERGRPARPAVLGEHRAQRRRSAPRPTRTCGPCRSSRRRDARRGAARPSTRRPRGSAATASAPASARTRPRRTRRTRRDARSSPRCTAACRPRPPRRPGGPGSAKSSCVASHSSSSHDAPIPNSNRPPENRSTVCTPRAVVNGCRSPMLNTWVPSRTRSVRAARNAEVRERVVDRRVGRDRRMVLARMRRAAHRPREHEVLGQPHRLVAELLGRDASRRGGSAG